MVEALVSGSLLAGAAVFMLYKAACHLRRRRDIAQWPRVDGIVLAHDVFTSGSQLRQRVKVRYQFGTRTIVHLVDSPTGAGRQRNSHDGRFAELPPVHSTVTLYVHPEHGEPAYRVLPEMTSIVALAIGGLLFLAAVAAGIVSAMSAQR